MKPSTSKPTRKWEKGASKRNNAGKAELGEMKSNRGIKSNRASAKRGANDADTDEPERNNPKRGANEAERNEPKRSTNAKRGAIESNQDANEPNQRSEPITTLHPSSQASNSRASKSVRNIKKPVKRNAAILVKNQIVDENEFRDFSTPLNSSFDHVDDRHVLQIADHKVKQKTNHKISHKAARSERNQRQKGADPKAKQSCDPKPSQVSSTGQNNARQTSKRRKTAVADDKDDEVILGPRPDYSGFLQEDLLQPYVFSPDAKHTSEQPTSRISPVAKTSAIRIDSENYANRRTDVTSSAKRLGRPALKESTNSVLATKKNHQHTKIPPDDLNIIHYNAQKMAEKHAAWRRRMKQVEKFLRDKKRRQLQEAATQRSN